MFDKHHFWRYGAGMALTFVNREAEIRELDAAARRGGLLVVYGRRRVGKSRLLVEWLERSVITEP